MVRTITIQLADDEFAAVQRLATDSGRTPAEVVVATLHAHVLSRAVPPPPASAIPEQAGEQITAADVARARQQAATQLAATTGRPVAEIEAAMRAGLAPRPRPPLTEAERLAAVRETQRFAGAVDGGDPHAADSARIDADLARDDGRGLERGEVRTVGIAVAARATRG